MKTLLNLCIFGLSLQMVSCTVPQTEDEKNEMGNSQDYLVHSTLYAQSAAEYKALCLQAYALAKIKVAEALANGTENPAVVLDLDETVLDNSPYTAWQIVSGNPYTPETWSKWVDAAEAEAIPGSVEFLQWADSAGVKLFYVSNRSVDGLHATIQNLKALDIPQADTTKIFLKTNTSDKSERRAKVKATGVNVVLYVGDNLGDYSEIWDKPASPEERAEKLFEYKHAIGSKFIVLPNSLYGTWEGSVYNYDRSISDQDRDSLRRANLRPWSGN
jgi:5'-nucleotidase (lipoprotein e(P4) family)